LSQSPAPLRELSTTIQNSIEDSAMNANTKPVTLTLNIVSDQDVTLEENDELIRRLRYEILEIEVESVERLSDEEAPAGAKGVDPVTFGALAVAVLPAVVPKIIEFLQSWVMRGENRTVKIKAQTEGRSIEVEYSPKSLSQAELKSLVDTLTGR
jgi:hypothetical protein